LYDARPARPRSQAELAAWLEGRREDSNAFTFGIRPLNDGTLIGTVELDGILWPHRVCGLAIAIGERSNWGKGYGSEAACLMIAFAFQELNLHRITATIFDYNKRSINLVERLGFCREGAFRGFLERDGVRHDMLLYGLLRPEWKAAQREE
jgi:RimJ/RimL family protein N-acetyltransferase